ncbi:MAG: aspartate kinase [Desulfobacteraceae bacterium]|nr:MAG: aspartate kinase [Desulfobacteraceae bacterium]
MILVEKIGGTSMSQFKEVLDNIILTPERKHNPYNRIFVVSAYGGVTNWLLENKKGGGGGVYAAFAQKKEYEALLNEVLVQLKALNRGFAELGLNLGRADDFITCRIGQTKNYLQNIAELISSGYVDMESIMLSAREILASAGEAHAAFNSAEILADRGYQAKFLDLSGFHDSEYLTIDQRIQKELSVIDFSKFITIATGYVKGTEGIMRKFDRGYTEVTFAKIAALLKVKEAVIHKEYHFCSADPGVVGENKAIPVGDTNYDVLDQLSDIWMEAVHPAVSKTLESAGVNLRIKNTFDSAHAGTLIRSVFRNESPRVEIISGTDQVMVIEVHDPAMVGAVGFDNMIMEVFSRFKVSYILKTTNANSISIVIRKGDHGALLDELKKMFFEVRVQEAALVCVLGTNISEPGILARAATALASKGINIECISQSLRQVNIQFVIKPENYITALQSLHECFFDPGKNGKV